MRTSSVHLPFRRWLLSAAAALAAFGATDSAWAQDGPKQVLVLYSTRRGAPISIAGDRELPRILEQGLANGLDYHSEYIDLGRFPEPEYQAAFSDFLRLKYSGQRLDLVVAIQTAAVEFVNKHVNELFPGTPVVFLASSPSNVRLANSTGVIAEPDLAGTLALAAELQPNLRQVFVVSGAAIPDKAYASLAQTQLRSFEPRFTVTYLSGLATKDLEARLSTLPAHSIVYFLVVVKDGAGQLVTPLEYVDWVTAVARAPTYSWTDALMGHGIVGGSLLDRMAMMETVAKLALRVLRGEPADGIPISKVDLYTRQVDWRQLRRWGISEARVPAGTRILFHDSRLWDRHKISILGAVGLVLAQSALIGGLLVQRARRRRAEAQARSSQVNLRTSYDRIRELGQRLLNAQEAERARIARDLHDDVGQQVALLAIGLGSLDAIKKKKPAEAAQLAREASERVKGIGKSLYDLSHQLHPSTLQSMGLLAALDGLQRDFSRPGLTIAFAHDNVPAPLAHDLSLCLFRIAQEAVGNAIKHSAAREVALHLSGDRDLLVLTIVDNGVGFDVEAVRGSGLGLISMVERLEPFGGRLNIRSTPGAGARLEVTVPQGATSATETVA